MPTKQSAQWCDYCCGLLASSLCEGYVKNTSSFQTLIFFSKDTMHLKTWQFWLTYTVSKKYLSIARN